MSIPVADDPWTETDPDGAWTSLTASAKHERILCAAWRLFCAEGLDAPMPMVAAAAGAGVGSLYRQFPSKRDLVAALVTRRLEQITQVAEAAIRQPGSRWQALRQMLWTIVELQHGDEILGEAWIQVADQQDVARATERAQNALDQLLGAARREGSVRADVDVLDIRLVFTATRAAGRVAPDAWKRMLQLLIDGLALGQASGP
jgi:AcrR family transcriptional regulator